MAPSIHFRLPPSWFFKFPPDEQPLALPPPTDARTFSAPFGIPTDIYNGALDYKVPITVATLYATTAIIWNRINRSRNYKPYAFSQTRAFKAFVILHNVFLAVFSGFTFFAMLRSLAHTWPGREHHLLGKYWPGLRAQYNLAGAADALCKMHGPRGFGQFVSYNPDSNLWNAQSKLVKLLDTGLPDGSDAGRLWNEGLAFWGWWFYLSKFYEVFDTFIILAKGKRSSTLQTYHHTGAMMCMWAGIRYMSPPIWMFCFLNSGIHTMMYVYYTLSALSIKVPQRIKRTLTTMQISQFLIGITFASMHLFVTYDIPLTKAEAVSKTLDQMASSVMGGASSVAASATSAGLAAWLKQAALRAAGEEGLAENVLSPPRGSIIRNAKQKAERYAPEQSYTAGYERIPCIDTSGQAFAVWLNLVYLFPLTLLFMRFFVKSYTRRGAARSQPKKDQAVKAIKDAANGTEREFNKGEDKVTDAATKKANGSAAPNGNKSNGTPRSRKVSDTINKHVERFEKGGEQLSDSAKSGTTKLSKKVSAGHDKLRRMFEDGSVSDRSKSPSQDRGRTMSSAEESVKETVEEAKEHASDTVEKIRSTVEDKVEKVEEAVATSPSQESESSLDQSTDGSSEKPSTESQESPKQPSELDQSWADVAKDTYPKQQQPTPPPESQSQQEDDRSSTPTMEKSRSLSPQKQSKLPRPKSREPQAREPSPVKKDQPSEAKKENEDTPNTGKSKKRNKPKKLNANSSSIPQLSNGNGTKPNTSSSSSPSKPDNTPAKAEVEKSSLPLSPAAPNSSVSSSTTKAEDEHKKDQSTNSSSQHQDAESSSDSKVEVEQGSDLQFRHVDGAKEGGEAERKEGVSFAEAAKGEDGGEGDVSID